MRGKVALVTGAATGIGRATALAFASEGARVVVSDVNEAEAENTVAEVRKLGAAVRFVRADVSNEADVEALIRTTLGEYGRLDVAFNNAGISGASAALADITKADWDRVLAVNLSGVFLCMKHEIAAMLRQGGGAIVNNASILGQVGFAGAAAYTATKHGVLGLTRCAALEYGTRGVRVNAVCPGFIVTPMLEHAGLLQDASTRHSIEAMHALKRMGEPREVAAAVLFLASAGASFVAGHPLLVDGGYVAQ